MSGENEQTDILSALRASIRAWPEYRRYQDCEKQMWRVPGLKAGVDALRRDIYAMGELDDAAYLAEARRLCEANADLLANPAAAAYLEAEAGLCRRIREYYRVINEEAAVHLP